MSKNKTRTQRVGHLDGLRAVCCMLVVWQHVSEVYRTVSSGGLWLSTMADTVDFGRIGVCAFFAISGFVIPSSIRGGRLTAILDFAERRVWRLYPPFLLSIPLGIVAVWTLWGKEPSVSLVSANVTMAASLWGEPYVMGHYWTLEVELVFYALAALVYLVSGPVRFGAGLVGVILFVVATHQRWFSGLPGHWPFLGVDMSVMFWGLCCRMAYEQWLPQWLVRYRWIVAALLMGLVLWEPLRLLWIGLDRGLAGHVRLGWGYSLGIVGFAVWTVAQLNSSFLEAIGRGTYSIYLLHPVAFYVGFKLLHTPAFASLQQLNLAWYLAAMMVVSVWLGMMGYWLVEQPADVCRRWLSKQRREAPHKAPASAVTEASAPPLGSQPASLAEPTASEIAP